MRTLWAAVGASDCYLPCRRRRPTGGRQSGAGGMEGAASRVFLRWAALPAIPARACGKKCVPCCWRWGRAATCRYQCSAATSRRLWAGAISVRVCTWSSHRRYCPGAAAEALASRRPVAGGRPLRIVHAHQRRLPQYGVGDCELVEEFAREVLPKLERQKRKTGYYLRAVSGERQPLLRARRDFAGRKISLRH